MNSNTRRSPSRKVAGLSLVELMVALTLGLVLTFALASVYLSSKTAFKRQGQVSSVQQGIRTAFEYLTSDARMVGHLGCFTGTGTPTQTSDLLASDLATNFTIGVAGYEYKNVTANDYTLSSLVPTDVTTSGSWETSSGTGVNTIPIASLSGDATVGITPGSDVLVIRTTTGAPVRMTAAVGAASTLAIESISGGKCGSGTAATSGFCANSFGLVANCTKARVFKVSSVAAAGAGATLTVGGGNFTAGEYAPDSTEVFPLRTIAYYVRKSSNGQTASLYRRVFDGTVAAGTEQELIEGVENVQITYGRDTTTPDADGVVNDYVTANQVTDWSRVVAVRISVLVRAADPLEAGTTAPSQGVVNGVTVHYPTTGAKYDRRVFTTTVAVRNKISYF